MNDYIKKDDVGLEVGAGPGLSKEFIKNGSLKISDFSDHKHLDFKNIDAQDTKFKENSYDFIIASNMIHHVPYPVKFFKEISINNQELFVTYDLLEVSLDSIEKNIENSAANLRKTLFDSIKRGIIHYSEDCELENLAHLSKEGKCH